MINVVIPCDFNSYAIEKSAQINDAHVVKIAEVLRILGDTVQAIDNITSGMVIQSTPIHATTSALVMEMERLENYIADIHQVAIHLHALAEFEGGQGG